MAKQPERLEFTSKQNMAAQTVLSLIDIQGRRELTESELAHLKPAQDELGPSYRPSVQSSDASGNRIRQM